MSVYSHSLLDNNILAYDPESNFFSQLQCPKTILRHVHLQLFLFRHKLDVESRAYYCKAKQHLQLHPMPSWTLMYTATEGNPSSTVAIEREFRLRWIRTGYSSQGRCASWAVQFRAVVAGC